MCYRKKKNERESEEEEEEDRGEINGNEKQDEGVEENEVVGGRQRNWGGKHCAPCLPFRIFFFLFFSLFFFVLFFFLL